MTMYKHKNAFLVSASISALIAGSVSTVALGEIALNWWTVDSGGELRILVVRRAIVE